MAWCRRRAETAAYAGRAERVLAWGWRWGRSWRADLKGDLRFYLGAFPRHLKRSKRSSSWDGLNQRVRPSAEPIINSAKPIATPRRASVGFVSLSPLYKIVVPCLTAVARALASTACSGFNGAGVFHAKNAAQDSDRTPLDAKCCRTGAAYPGFASIRSLSGSPP